MKSIDLSMAISRASMAIHYLTYAITEVDKTVVKQWVNQAEIALETAKQYLEDYK